jgi:hypothetical protein
MLKHLIHPILLVLVAFMSKAQSQLPITAQNLEGIWILASIDGVPFTNAAADSLEINTLVFTADMHYLLKKGKSEQKDRYFIKGFEIDLVFPQTMNKNLVYQKVWVISLESTTLILQYSEDYKSKRHLFTRKK